MLTDAEIDETLHNLQLQNMGGWDARAITMLAEQAKAANRLRAALERIQGEFIEGTKLLYCNTDTVLDKIRKTTREALGASQ